MTVTVQSSLFAKSTAGSSVNLVGPPLTAATCAPLETHEIENHGSTTSTASSKVIAMLAPAATAGAPDAGLVEATAGAASTASVVKDQL